MRTAKNMDTFKETKESSTWKVMVTNAACKAQSKAQDDDIRVCV